MEPKLRKNISVAISIAFKVALHNTQSVNNMIYDSSSCFLAVVGYKKVRVSRETDSRERFVEEDVKEETFAGR